MDKPGARTSRPNVLSINARSCALPKAFATGKFAEIINKLYKTAGKATAFGQSKCFAQVGEICRG